MPKPESLVLGTFITVLLVAAMVLVMFILFATGTLPSDAKQRSTENTDSGGGNGMSAAKKKQAVSRSRAFMQSFKHLEKQARATALLDSASPTLSSSSSSNGFDHVYFINLAHRTDRLAHVLQEIEKMGWSSIATRIDAVKHTNGEIGCLRSHVKAMRTFLASPHKTALVLEDDVEFKNPDESRKLIHMFVEAHPTRDWDILLLSAWVTRKKNWRPYAWRVKSAMLCTAYVVTRPAAARLIEVWTRTEGILPCDNSWNEVLSTSRTYALLPLLASQIESFSDIRNEIVPKKDMMDVKGGLGA